jgi:hypothetical protein
MLLQKEKFSQWFENDKKLLNTKITMRELNKFVGADFEISETNNEKIIKQGKYYLNIVSEWVEIKSKHMNQENDNNTELNDQKESQLFNNNIILKNKIIKLKESLLNLRSLGIEVELNFLMAGESSFYIFTRGKNEFDKEMTICYINKELDSNRKFINFAILEESHFEESYLILKNLKKQEIPKQGIIDN